MTLAPESTPIPSQTDIHKSVMPIRSLTLMPVMRLFCILTLVGAIGTVLGNLHTGYWFLIVFSILALGWQLVSTFVKAIPYLAQVIGVLVILFAYAIYGLISVNPVLDGRILLAGFIIATFLFKGVRFGIYASILSEITFLVYGGFVFASLSTSQAGTAAILGLITSSIYFTMALVAITGLMAFFVNVLEKELAVNSLVRTNLIAKINQFDLSLQKVTGDYKRSEQTLDSIDRFIKQFTTDLSPEVTLQKAIAAIKDQFGYYFIGAFEKDEKGEYGVLKAGTGQEGTILLNRNFRLKLSDMGIISYCFNHAELRMSPNIREDLNFMQNPLLPATLSELAIPLIYEEKVIGVLDIQSNKINAFSPEELIVLRTLADQIAVSYQKAQLSKQFKKVNEEVEATYQQFTQKSWRAHLRQTRRKFSYRYQGNAIDKEAIQSNEITMAINENKSIVMQNQKDLDTGDISSSVAVPIRLRGQVIGAMDIKIGAGQIPSDFEPLIETICNRLALALENARLVEEIQNKANREHQVSQISNKIRSSPNVEQVLRTAVTEIGQTLGASEVLIHLHSDQ